MGLWDALTGGKKAPTMGEVQKSDYNSRSVPVMSQGYGNPQDDQMERSLSVGQNPGSHDPAQIESLHKALDMASSMGTAGIAKPNGVVQDLFNLKNLQKMREGNPLVQAVQTQLPPKGVDEAAARWNARILNQKAK